MDKLSEFLSSDHSRLLKLLVILDQSGGIAMPVRDIKEIAVGAGLRSINQWNPSQILKTSKGMATLYPDGWKITNAGKNLIKESGWDSALPDAQNLIDDLSAAAAKIKDPHRKTFVLEAIACYAHGYYRAAVVLSWSGAISLIHADLFCNYLAPFNHEAKQRGWIKKDITVIGEMEEIKEYNILQIAKTVGAIDKNEKQNLEERLRFRNSSGHPNNLQIGQRMVAAHLESLIINVFNKF